MNRDVFQPDGAGELRPESLQPAEVKPFTPPPADGGQLSETDVDISGAQIARDMVNKGYQPVIFVGTANSGKTSVLLSLLALLRRRPELQMPAFLDEALAEAGSKLGNYQREMAITFFNRNVQNFIDGQVIAKTTVNVPFFVPVSVRPTNGTNLTFAFMESSGEWFQPKRNTNELFPPLKRHIEEFISTYEGGIIFIYALPFTQQQLWSTGADMARDASQIADADLAVAGALQSYSKVRFDKTHDRHLFLVTKWDGTAAGGNVTDTLVSTTHGHVSSFANEKYPQSMSLLNNFGVDRERIALDHYCAAIINAQGPQIFKADNPLSEIVLKYPRDLWDFLYKQALINAGYPAKSPFPAPPPKPWWQRVLDMISD